MNFEQNKNETDIVTEGERIPVHERIQDKINFLKEMVGVTPPPTDTEKLALDSNELLSYKRRELEEKLGGLHVDLDQIESGEIMDDKLKGSKGGELFALGASVPSLGIALSAASSGNAAGAGVATALTVGLMSTPVLNRVFAKGAEIKSRMTKQVEYSRTQRDIDAIDSVEQSRE